MRPGGLAGTSRLEQPEHESLTPEADSLEKEDLKPESSPEELVQP